MHKLDSFVKESLRISPIMSGLFVISNVPLFRLTHLKFLLTITSEYNT